MPSMQEQEGGDDSSLGNSEMLPASPEQHRLFLDISQNASSDTPASRSTEDLPGLTASQRDALEIAVDTAILKVCLITHASQYLSNWLACKTCKSHNTLRSANALCRLLLEYLWHARERFQVQMAMRYMCNVCKVQDVANAYQFHY